MTDALADMLRADALPEMQARPERFARVRDELRALARDNLYFLVKAVLAPYTPGYDAATITPGMHGRIAQFCGTPPARFTLLMAFRGGRKSTFGTVGRSVQQMLRGPQEVLIFSEAALMAEKWSREARAHFEGTNRMLEWLYPELMGAAKTSNKWGDAMWRLPHGGSVQAAGLDTQLMGAHVDHLIMDDVFSDPKGDKTPEYAARIVQWVRMSLPLLKNPSTGHRYLIGVPWWVEGEPYADFRASLPAAAQCVLPLIDEVGACAWPEAFPPDVVDELRLDPFVFQSQYLLSPVSQETAIFKRGVLRMYDERPRDRTYMRTMTFDPAFTANARSHSNAYAVADVDAKGGVWIEHAERRKLDAHAATRWAVERAIAHKPRFLGIECNGPQRVFYDAVKRALMQYPLSHPARSIVLVELKPVRDKIARWNALASGFAGGQVHMRRGLTELASELYRVTGARHEANDLTDAAAHLVGPELARKKPMRLTEQSPDAWLPHALRDDPARRAPANWMAM